MRLGRPLVNSESVKVDAWLGRFSGGMTVFLAPLWLKQAIHEYGQALAVGPEVHADWQFLLLLPAVIGSLSGLMGLLGSAMEAAYTDFWG